MQIARFYETELIAYLSPYAYQAVALNARTIVQNEFPGQYL